MNLGAIYIIVAQFIWASEIILIRRFFPSQNPIFISAITSFVASFFYLPTTFIFKQKLFVKDWLVLFVLGFISFFLAQILYITGIQKGTNIFITILTTLTYYLFAVILGIMFLKDPITLRIIIGGLVMIVGFVILFVK